MFWRVVQAAGTSSGISVGGGVLGDIYKVEERGTAIGLFMGVRVPIVNESQDRTLNIQDRLPFSAQHSPRSQVVWLPTTRRGGSCNTRCSSQESLRLF